MPSGIYIRTDYHKEISSKAMIGNNNRRGKITSIGTRKKQSESAKNRRGLRILRETRKCQCSIECIDNFECKVNSKRRFIWGHHARITSKNRVISDEQKKKISETISDLWKTKEYGDMMLEAITKNSSNNRMFNNKSTDLKVKQYLSELGLDEGKDYIFQYVLRGLKLVSVVDFFFPKLNLIIETDGDYWHCNPKKYKADYIHKHKKMTAEQIWEQDRLRTEELKSKGFNVIRIWECDINKNIIECILINQGEIK